MAVFAVSAQSASKGSTGAQILEMIPDARTVAMGETFCGIADDANSLYYNPAGLAVIRCTEIPVSNSNWLQGINQQYIGFAYSLRDVRAVNVQDMGTVAAGLSEVNSGDIIGRDINGNKTDVFRSQDRLITVAYGKTVFEDNYSNKIMAGASAKFINEEMKNEKMNNLAFDAGVLCDIPAMRLSLGLSVQNMGGKLKYAAEEFDLPLIVRAGASYKMLNNSLLIGLDLSKPNYSGVRANIGAEYYFMKTIAVRAGYKPLGGQDLGISAGFGISMEQLDVLFMYMRELNIDYAFVPYGELGDTHKITLTLKLGAE